MPLFLTKPFLHFTPGAEHTALIAGKIAARPQPPNRAPSVPALAKRKRLATDLLVLCGSADQRQRVVARTQLTQRRQPQAHVPVGDLCHSRREHGAVTRERRMLGCAVVVVELRVCSRRTRSICLGRPIYKMITGDTSARTDPTVQCCFVWWDPAANDGRSLPSAATLPPSQLPPALCSKWYLSLVAAVAAVQRLFPALRAYRRFQRWAAHCHSSTS